MASWIGVLVAGKLMGKGQNKVSDDASIHIPLKKEKVAYKSLLVHKEFSDCLCYCGFARASRAIEPTDWMAALFVN